jgi:hypothetical protein
MQVLTPQYIKIQSKTGLCPVALGDLEVLATAGGAAAGATDVAAAGFLRDVAAVVAQRCARILSHALGLIAWSGRVFLDDNVFHWASTGFNYLDRLLSGWNISLSIGWLIDAIQQTGLLLWHIVQRG